MVCFDISNRESFKNIKDYYIPELSHYNPNTPRLLVGFKSGKLLIMTHKHIL